MRTVVSILAITCAIIVAGVLSGQIVPSDRTVLRKQSPENARTRALQALDAVDRRLNEIGAFPGSASESNGAGKELKARSRAIRDRVEGTDPEDASQRGAWAGLRASIADLEYRTDILVLAVRSGTMGFQAGAQPTIDETFATVEKIRAGLDVQGRLDHATRLDRIRTELERLRIETADDVTPGTASEATRSSWAGRLANLRRELRSIGRSHARRNAARSSR